MSRHEDSHKKAKHEANQDALDRLYEKYEQARHMQGSRLMYTLRKAAKSLQACPTPVTTLKEAKALHGVGDSLARVMLPTVAEHLVLSRQSSISSTVSTTKDSLHDSTRNNTEKNKCSTDTELCDDKKLMKSISDKEKAYQTSVKKSESLVLPNKAWRVILIVDGREHGWEKVLARLQMSGIPSEKRNLPIGDMAWIARSGSVEIMLGTIVERKEVHDLASSLFGTRYKEQRLRLQNCGIPQLFLLVEGDTKEVANCSQEQLNMAMMETRVHLNFQVVQTRHLDDTVRFLKSVHRRILQRSFPFSFLGDLSPSLPSFSSPTVNQKKKRSRSMQKQDENKRGSFHEMVFDRAPVTPFESPRFMTYQELKCKVEKDREEGTKTIGAIFCSMLKQIHKISNSTIPPIVQVYPTPTHFFQTLEGMNISEGKNLLSQLASGNQKLGEQKCLELYYTFTAMAGGEQSNSKLSSQNTPQENILDTIIEKSNTLNVYPSLDSDLDIYKRSSTIHETSQISLNNSTSLRQDKKELSSKESGVDHLSNSSNLVRIDLDKNDADTLRDKLETVPFECLDALDKCNKPNSRESIDSLDMDILAFVSQTAANREKSRIELSLSSDEDSIDTTWDSVTFSHLLRKKGLPLKPNLDVSTRNSAPTSPSRLAKQTFNVLTTSQTYSLPNENSAPTSPPKPTTQTFLLPPMKQNLKDITNQFRPLREAKEVIELLD